MPELPPDVLRTLLATALAAEGNSLAAWLRLSLVSPGWRDAVAGDFSMCTDCGIHSAGALLQSVSRRHRRQRAGIAALGLRVPCADKWAASGCCYDVDLSSLGTCDLGWLGAYN